jgi:hypothetical protein
MIMIPVDRQGNKLFVKDFQKGEEGRMFLEYKTTLNDIPFRKTEVFFVDMCKNIAITGSDGTILYRFSAGFLMD